MKKPSRKKAPAERPGPRPSSQGAPSRRGGPGTSTWVALALLVATPGYALGRLATRVDGWLLLVVPLAVSTCTFLAYRSDKRRAGAGEWRVPESTLHLAELAGGWPGAFLAQRAFRHKTAKASYQIVFWAIVLVHEFVALDSLLGWRFTQDFVRFVKSQIA